MYIKNDDFSIIKNFVFSIDCDLLSISLKSECTNTKKILNNLETKKENDNKLNYLRIKEKRKANKFYCR